MSLAYVDVRVLAPPFLSLAFVPSSDPAIHALAMLCLVSGIILAVVQVMHYRARRPLYLIDRPGTTIGAVGAMLSQGASAPRTPGGFHDNPHSFIALLDPRDTNDDVEEKLKNKRFRLNPHSGTVELESDVSDEMPTSHLPATPGPTNGHGSFPVSPREHSAFPSA